MRIWSFVSEKGGSGKTDADSCSCRLQRCQRSLQFSVLDLDPQRSAEQWADLREDQLGALEPTNRARQSLRSGGHD